METYEAMGMRYVNDITALLKEQTMEYVTYYQTDLKYDLEALDDYMHCNDQKERDVRLGEYFGSWFDETQGFSDLLLNGFIWGARECGTVFFPVRDLLIRNTVGYNKITIWASTMEVTYLIVPQKLHSDGSISGYVKPVLPLRLKSVTGEHAAHADCGDRFKHAKDAIEDFLEGKYGL